MDAAAPRLYATQVVTTLKTIDEVLVSAVKSSGFRLAAGTSEEKFVASSIGRPGSQPQRFLFLIFLKAGILFHVSRITVLFKNLLAIAPPVNY